MKRIIMALSVFFYAILLSCAVFANSADDAAAGLAPETAKQAMFTPADPGDTGVASVTAEDAGLSSEIAGAEAASEGAEQTMEDEMDAGVTDDMSE